MQWIEQRVGVEEVETAGMGIFSSCLAEEHFGGGNAIVENLFFQWSCRSRRKYRNTGNNKTNERRGRGSTAQTSDFLLTGGYHFYFVRLLGGNDWPASFMCWVVFSVGLGPLEIGRQATSKEFLEWIQGHFPLANVGFPTSWESWLHLGLSGGKLVADEGRRAVKFGVRKAAFVPAGQEFFPEPDIVAGLI